VRYLNARDGVALAWEMHLVSGGSQCSYAGDHNSVYVTHDGGRHFTLAAHCAHRPDELCTSALFLDPRHLLVGRNDGSLTTSADGGRTFREQAGLPTVLGPQPTSSSTDEWFWIQGFALSGQRVFATTKLAGAYLSDDAGRTWVREPSCDTGYTLGIGEVAAFDRERAIAGGPSCIATRTDGSATTGTAVWPTPPRVPSGDVDVTSSAAGVRAAVSGGRLLVTRLSGAGPKDTAAAS
jgi:hypothetical protein